jgi:hypothetical protein
MTVTIEESEDGATFTAIMRKEGAEDVTLANGADEGPVEQVARAYVDRHKPAAFNWRGNETDRVPANLFTKRSKRLGTRHTGKPRLTHYLDD